VCIKPSKQSCRTTRVTAAKSFDILAIRLRVHIIV